MNFPPKAKQLDIADVIGQRIREGYCFNPGLNKDIVERGKEAEGLAAFWAFFQAVEQKDLVSNWTQLKLGLKLEQIDVGLNSLI